MQKQKGFSFIELLVAAAIIGILSSIVLSAVGTGVLQASSDGWNGSPKYFQISN